MVVLHGGPHPIEGWTLNMSRGGMRAILDETVPAGNEFELSFGQSSARRPVRVVWARAEKGGAIVGMAFLDVNGGSIPPPPSRPRRGGARQTEPR